MTTTPPPTPGRTFTSAPPPMAKPVRTDMERDIREIRNWARFIGLVVMLSVLAGIISAALIIHAVTQVQNNTNQGTSNLCQSQGGPIQGC
jgi:hypothetical protein